MTGTVDNEDNNIKTQDGVKIPITTPVAPEKPSVTFKLEENQTPQHSSKILIEEEKYGTLLKPTASSRVRFAVSDNVMEIPGRSSWQKKWRPCCNRVVSLFCAMIYMMCFPFIELFQFCAVCCQKLGCGPGKKY